MIDSIAKLLRNILKWTSHSNYENCNYETQLHILISPTIRIFFSKM